MSVDVRRVLSFVLEKHTLVRVGKKHWKCCSIINKIPKIHSVNEAKIYKHYIKSPTPEPAGYFNVNYSPCIIMLLKRLNK